MNLLGMKRPKTKDIQRQRVYDFEDTVLCKSLPMRAISKEKCKDLIDHVMTEFGMEHVPVVVSWFEAPHAECTVNRVRGTVHINLPREFRRELWVLHEVAHAVGASDHGPRFLACYFVFLDTYFGMDFDALVEATKGFNLKVGLRRYAPKRVKRSRKVLNVAA